VPQLKDNYAYLVLDAARRSALVVDCSEPAKVLSALKAKAGLGVDALTHVLTTHKHGDHSGGNKGLVKARPGLVVVGGDQDQVRCLLNLF